MFLNNFASPLILDEIQYVPQLLPALKRRVDESDKKGQYFLTGSQNLSMLKTVSESMAGRVGILNLEGFTPEEMLGFGDRKGWLSVYMAAPGDLQASVQGVYGEFSNLAQFLWRGTYPGTVDIPDEGLNTYFRSYLQTYVDRSASWRISKSLQILTGF